MKLLFSWTRSGLAVLLCLLCLTLPRAAAASPQAGGEFIAEILSLMESGRYEEAENRLASQETPISLRLRLELLKRRGQWEEADNRAGELMDLYRRRKLQSAEEVSQAAFAAWHLQQWKDANQIYIEAAKLPDVPPSLYVDWGNLYLQQYNAAEAEGIFRDALRAEPNKSPTGRWGMEAVYLGIARALEAQGKPGVSEALDKAEEARPSSPAVAAERARVAIQELDWDASEKALDKGLSSNPNDLDLLELKAARYYLKGETREYEKARDQVLAVNPANGDFFELLGDLSVPQRRFEDAIQFYSESVRRNPRQWSALASMGINLLRVGRESEGKQMLEKAYAHDPFNIWTVNTLRLLDSFDRFARFESSHFLAKIEEDEVEALRPYVSDLLEESLTALGRKYGFEPKGKYVFEMYGDHEDFAVRALGLPGLGALGATFGRVVAMDSPSAREAGTFHWGSTLWHEVAHIVTLELSDHKVPRWFTEGISMMEERLARPGWGDFISPGFVQAYEKDQLLSLEDLNGGFERPQFPGQIELSYFQAGWLCDFLAARYGTDKIRSMLVAFGQGKTMDHVIQDVLDSSVSQLDKEFRAEMDKTLKPLVAAMKPPKELDLPGDELQLAAVLFTVKQNPDSYPANVAAARKLMEAQREAEAVPYLERALEIFPYLSGSGSPYGLLAKIYEKSDDKEKRLDLLRRWWRIDPKRAATGRQLALLLRQKDQPGEAIEVLHDVMYVDPLSADSHQTLGELYLGKNDAAAAVREFKILLALNPVDKAGAHFNLAQALAESGDKQKARREVLLALEIAPTYPDAQKLLLKLARQ